MLVVFPNVGRCFYILMFVDMKSALLASVAQVTQPDATRHCVCGIFPALLLCRWLIRFVNATISPTHPPPAVLIQPSSAPSFAFVGVVVVVVGAVYK